MIYEPILDVQQFVTYHKYVNASSEIHFHQSIEIIYCHEGVCEINSGEDNYCLFKGEIAFIPSFFAHSTKSHKGAVVSVYIIPYNYFRNFIEKKIYMRFGKLEDVEFNKRIIREIIDSVDSLKNQPNILLEGYTTVILGLIASHYKVDKDTSVKMELMMKIVEYINDNYKENITLSSISSYFGYSKYYFSRMFNKTFKCSLNFYVNQIRKNNVLSNSDKNKKITDVIMDNGFNTISSFYRTKKQDYKKKSRDKTLL